MPGVENARERAARDFRERVLGSGVYWGCDLIAATGAALLGFLTGNGLAGALSGIATVAGGAGIAYVFQRSRAPVRVRDDEIAELRKRNLALQPAPALDLVFETAVTDDPPVNVNGHPSQLVMLIIRNRGRRCCLEAKVVSKSVRGVGEEYPQGAFVLGWQTPNGESTQVIAQGDDGRVDVAWVATNPDTSIMRFVGPGTIWKELHAQTKDPVTGLIDLVDSDQDLRQRLRFEISTGVEHPIDMTVTPVSAPLPADL